MEEFKRDPLFRMIGILLLAVLAFGLVYSLLFGSMSTVGYGNHYGGGHFGMSGQATFGYGPSFGLSITSLLMFIIKILFILLIIGLVVGIAKAIRQEVLPNININPVQGLICASPQQAQIEVKQLCAGCGRELHSDWKVCPYCAKEKLI